MGLGEVKRARDDLNALQTFSLFLPAIACNPELVYFLDLSSGNFIPGWDVRMGRSISNASSYFPRRLPTIFFFSLPLYQRHQVYRN